MGRPVAFEMDVIAEISKSKTQKDRLPAAQTLVSISGMERSAAQTALALDKVLSERYDDTDTDVSLTQTHAVRW